MSSTVFPPTRRRVHPAFVVAGTTFVVVLFSASVRGAITLLIQPIMKEFHWSRGTVTAAASINLALFGLMGPFASALMVRFGLRKVVATALAIICVGALLSTQVREPWQLWLSWGVIMGTGQGCLASVLAANVATAWFYSKRNTVVGILNAASTAGGLIFIELNTHLVATYSWRFVSGAIAIATAAAVPLVFAFVRNKPEDVGTRAYGAPEGYATQPKTGNPIRLAFSTLADVWKSRMFVLLFGSFFVCGLSTSGLIQVHFVPAASDAHIANSTAARLLVLVGICDLIGAIMSGWLTDRFDPRKLLFAYYGFRGLSLLVFDRALASGGSSFRLLAVIVFYGLDWIATVPPTVALANRCFGTTRGGVVYGWLFAGHQLGGAIAAQGAAWMRDWTGSYRLSFMIGGVFALVAAFGALSITGTEDSEERAEAIKTNRRVEPAAG
jgi:MFS family permease